MASGHDWHPEDVKAAIRKTGITLSALSMQFGYESSSVRKMLARPSPVLQGLVARHLGVDPSIIWPSRYDEHGNPLRHKNNPSRESAGRPRQTGVAA